MQVPFCSLQLVLAFLYDLLEIMTALDTRLCFDLYAAEAQNKHGP